MSTDERIITLQQELNAHVEAFNLRCEEDEIRREEEERRWQHLMQITEQNQQSIHELATSISGMVSAWQAVIGAVKVGSTFGKFLKWCTQLAVIGVAAAWVMDTFGS